MPQKPQNQPDSDFEPGPIELFENHRMDQLMRFLSSLFDAVIVTLCFWLVSLLLDQWPVPTLVGVALFAFAVTWTERR